MQLIIMLKFSSGEVFDEFEFCGDDEEQVKSRKKGKGENMILYRTITSTNCIKGRLLQYCLKKF